MNFQFALRNFALTICLTITLSICSYSQPVQKQETELTPSPTSSSLGIFGGAEVKKTTGGLNKLIPLFNLKEGAIDYTPSISYYSTGVMVNDWGNRLGIGWSENITGIITRTVNSIPDEEATIRINQQPSLLNDMTDSVLDVIKSIYNSIPMGEGTDGQYDIFSYNLLGLNGQFVIENGQAIMLNRTDSSVIEVIGTNPYKFKITTNEGLRFYFGVNSDIEYTSYSNENVCDDGSSVFTNLPTSWFLSKIVSPFNDSLVFTYSNTSYSYMHDYNESYVFRHLPYNGMLEYSNCENPSLDYSVCVRKKATNTKSLTQVEGVSFKVTFEYSSRADLFGDGILEKATLFNYEDSVISQYNFLYD